MLMKLSVRHKVILIILTLGALFFSGILFFAGVSYRNLVLEKNSNDLTLISELVSSRVKSEILGMKDHISFVAAHNETLRSAVKEANAGYGELSEEEVAVRLKEIDILWDKGAWVRLEEKLAKSPASQILMNLKQITGASSLEISITDMKGVIVATTGKTDSYCYAEEVWWKNTYMNGFGSRYYLDTMNSTGDFRPEFILSCPVVDVDGEAIGVLRCVFDKDRFFESLLDIYLGKGAFAGILSSNGHLAFSLDLGLSMPRGFYKSIFDLINFKNAASAHTLRSPETGDLFVVGFSKIQGVNFDVSDEWYIYCARDVRQIFASLNVNNISLSFVWLVMMVFLYILSIFIANKVTEPIEIFKRGFSKIKKGDLCNGIDIRSGDEFQELAVDFNEMVAELRQGMVSMDYFNKIIQNMSDILFVVNPQGFIDIVNKRACELLGYTIEELRGKEAVGIFSKKDRYIISWGLKGLIDEAALKDKKISLLTKAGKEIDVYLGTRSILDISNNMVGLVCLAKDLSEITGLLEDLERSRNEIEKHKINLERSLKDLTESRDVMLSILEDTDESKKQLEVTFQKLKDTQNELIQAAKMVSLGQIAAGVAHEINNPLFVISGEAEMMEMDGGLTDSVKESVHTIREQVSRIGDIIKRLLEFSRKKEVTFVRIDINELLEKSIQLLQYQAKASGRVTIINELLKEPVFVFGDQNQLHEVFLNIMLNGIQATEVNGGTLTIRSFFDIIQHDDAKKGLKLKVGQKVAVVQFSDTGPGMSAETLKRIFEPFFTTKKTGTGLGLSVCFGIVENHGGAIDCDSVEGEGTVFKIKLPLAEKEEK